MEAAKEKSRECGGGEGKKPNQHTRPMWKTTKKSMNNKKKQKKGNGKKNKQKKRKR